MAGHSYDLTRRHSSMQNFSSIYSNLTGVGNLQKWPKKASPKLFPQEGTNNFAVLSEANEYTLLPLMRAWIGLRVKIH